VLPEASLLRFFVPEELGEREPLDGLFVGTFRGGDETCDGGRHLGAQRDSAFPLIDEIEELGDDLVAGLVGIQLKGFERWTIVFSKSVAARGFAPATEDMLTEVTTPRLCGWERFWVKVAKTGQTFHSRGSLAGLRGFAKILMKGLSASQKGGEGKANSTSFLATTSGNGKHEKRPRIR
jgi:hypothetical protein